jgi:hypothetical protein
MLLTASHLLQESEGSDAVPPTKPDSYPGPRRRAHFVAGRVSRARLGFLRATQRGPNTGRKKCTASANAFLTNLESERPQRLPSGPWITDRKGELAAIGR